MSSYIFVPYRKVYLCGLALPTMWLYVNYQFECHLCCQHHHQKQAGTHISAKRIELTHRIMPRIATIQFRQQSALNRFQLIQPTSIHQQSFRQHNTVHAERNYSTYSEHSLYKKRRRIHTTCVCLTSAFFQFVSLRKRAFQIWPSNTHIPCLLSKIFIVFVLYVS
ncbi:hypothetical protein BU16DRAFT_108042 [Lophium mytilinum]|uniref:Uncharacterized protein n=1 Tax=Lophium mytilinum TaxID=390894 RepID=A0A6A6QKN6_9PEZI|nr:hypothetical protein BU16DRAFT_108042 [Lophium mytilinum]